MRVYPGAPANARIVVNAAGGQDSAMTLDEDTMRIRGMNALKERLLAGKPVIGVSVMIPSPQIAEMVGHLGFDWTLIDCEHGSISPDQVESLAPATVAADIAPIARPMTSSSRKHRRAGQP